MSHDLVNGCGNPVQSNESNRMSTTHRDSRSITHLGVMSLEPMISNILLLLMPCHRILACDSCQKENKRSSDRVEINPCSFF